MPEGGGQRAEVDESGKIEEEAHAARAAQRERVLNSEIRTLNSPIRNPFRMGSSYPKPCRDFWPAVKVKTAFRAQPSTSAPTGDS